MHLDGRARCPTCGHSLGDRLPVIPGWAGDLHARFIAGRRPERIALVPAAAPLLMVLPLATMGWGAVSIARRARAGDMRDAARRWAPALILAVLNIVVSAWILSVASRELLDALLWVWGQVLAPFPGTPEGSPQVFDA